MHWLLDAIAWGYGAKKEWGQHVSGLITSVVDVDLP